MKFNLWTLALAAAGLISIESAARAQEQFEFNGIFKAWIGSRKIL